MPDITVIIPYHNEKANVEFALERVGAQTLPAPAAILVNSSSTDDTSEVVDRWIRSNQHRFVTRFSNVFDHTDNPASSKNAGIRRAATEWVAFMDCGQNFGKDWLEQQSRFAQEHGLEVVSGGFYAVGENWVDRCAIAQTYGYKRFRPSVPSTLARKAVFEKTGLFLERRAGYDFAWPIKLRKLGIARGINKNARIAYFGFNFASNLPQLFRKSVLYNKPTVAIDGYLVPYLYAILPLVFVGTLVFSVEIALLFLLLYFLARSFALPIFKSRGIAFFVEHPLEALLGLGVVGLVIDLGRLLGTWQGFHYFWLKSHAPHR